MVWDVTVTYAESHIGDTVTEAGAESNKVAKYNELACVHITSWFRNRRYLESLAC